MPNSNSEISVLKCCDALSAVMDLINPKITNHHRKTAYIGYQIALEMQLAPKIYENILLAGLLHDIGAFSLQNKMDNLLFEIAQPHVHAEMGYLMLREAEPFSHLARIVRYHHTTWRDGQGEAGYGEVVPLESHILHLADRISVLIPEQSTVLYQAEELVRDIQRFAGTWFQPALVDAFANLAKREYFWLDVSSPSPLERLQPLAVEPKVALNTEYFLSLVKLFSRIIDFRSHYTATHSLQVAVAAENLAKLCGFPDQDHVKIRVAGYLHDLGKLAVPKEILEKSAGFSPQEWYIMRAHPYYSFQCLRNIPGMETINLWASLHHEKIDGSGYPFHLSKDQLPLGARVVAVADVFAALIADRPYRKALSKKQALLFLNTMVETKQLDGDVVAVLQEHHQDVFNSCLQAAEEEITEYKKITK